MGKTKQSKYRNNTCTCTCTCTQGSIAYFQSGQAIIRIVMYKTFVEGRGHIDWVLYLESTVEISFVWTAYNMMMVYEIVCCSGISETVLSVVYVISEFGVFLDSVFFHLMGILNY